MPIKYSKVKLKDIKFNDDDFLVFPTDYKIRLFPPLLKTSMPNSFEIFKELSAYIKVNNAEPPKAFFFPPFTNLKLVSIVCVGDDKLIEYDDLFNSLEFINEENDDCTIYILEEWFNEYLRNFEAFEYDIEKAFSNEDCTIVIINQPKDYIYDYEETPTP